MTLFATSIVMIHGAFTNPDCLQPWCDRYRARGYECVAPAWPFNEGTVDELRASPRDGLSVVGVPDLVDHYAGIVQDIDDDLVLIGHSFGGLVVQMLLDDGYGDAGVALAPAPPKGVPPRGKAIRANAHVLRTWGGGRKVVEMKRKHFDWAFGNALPEDQRAEVYDRYIVPTPGRPFFQVAWAGFHKRTRVDWANDDRAPLLLVSGGQDRTVTAKMVRAQARKYARSDATTVLHEYDDRGHWMIGEPGWQEVADFVISWVEINVGLHPEPPASPEELEFVSP